MMKLTMPISECTRMRMQAGDEVLISGVLYTARDAAHKRLVETWRKEKKLPFDVQGQAVYYVGPTPASPNQVIGSAGPTSSYRMDPYSIELMDAGLLVMIGKGDRSEAFRHAIQEKKGLYFIAVGGIGALLSQKIKSSEVVLYDDLGTEAIRKITVEDFPCIVAYDAHGASVFPNW